MALHKVEQINPNDTELKVVSVLKSSGDFVSSGDLIFELEGQKAVIEVVANESGNLGFFVKEGDNINIDDFLYCISSSPEELEKEIILLRSQNEKIFIDKVEFDIKETEENEIYNFSEIKFSHNKIRIVVIPGGKAFRQVEDALKGNHNLEVVGYFDDSERSSPQKIGNLDVEQILGAWRADFFDRVFVASGNEALRKKLLLSLSQAGVKFVNVIHPSANVSDSAILGANIFIGPNCVIGPRSIIGNGCFISAFSNIEHHCALGDFCLLGPGVMLSGSVSVGFSTTLGAGVSVESNIAVGSNVYVASGKGVTRNVPSGKRLL